MKRNITRLTEKDLHRVIIDTVSRILNESRQDGDIRMAQKELYSMGRNLSSIGMRLEGTQFHKQYHKMKDEIVNLNNALIEYIRKGKE